MLIVIYATTYGWRCLRDVYSAQFYLLFTGQVPPSWIYFVTDLPGALIAVAIIITLIKVRDNRRAFYFLLLIIFIGTVIIGLFTILFKYAGFSGYWWMGLNSLGINMVYLTYFPLLFDRLIATCRTPMSAVVLCNTTDGIGQLFGTLALLIGNFVSLNSLSFFTALGIGMFVLNVAMVSLSALFFRLRIRIEDDFLDGAASCSEKLGRDSAAPTAPPTEGTLSPKTIRTSATVADTPLTSSDGNGTAAGTDEVLSSAQDTTPASV